MSGWLVQVLCILAVVVLFGAVLVRPGGIVPVVLAVGVVVAAIFVTWSQVESYRAQRTLGVPQPQASAGVTVPPPSFPRAGS